MNGRMSPKRRARWRMRAAILYELAIILPVLLSIVLGCVDFGRFANAYICITNACGEAATFGAHNPPTDFGTGVPGWIAAVRQRAVDEAYGLRPPIDAAEVTVELEPLAEGVVVVHMNYEFETLVPWPGVPENVLIRRVAVAPQIP